MSPILQFCLMVICGTILTAAAMKYALDLGIYLQKAKAERPGENGNAPLLSALERNDTPLPETQPIPAIVDVDGRLVKVNLRVVEGRVSMAERLQGAEKSNNLISRLDERKLQEFAGAAAIQAAAASHD